MKCLMLLATTGVLIATVSLTLPSLDWQAALIVGAIVAVAVAALIFVAIATPFVAIQGGATVIGTCLAVGAIALVAGAIAGIAAGLYWGREGDIKRQEQIESIKRISNQLDIFFEPSADPERAADFECTIVAYEEGDLSSQGPTVTTKKEKISAVNSEQFYGLLDERVKRWAARQVSGDEDGQPRRVKIYMHPYPGEGTYERLKQLVEQNPARPCVVIKVEGPWVSAVPD